MNSNSNINQEMNIRNDTNAYTTLCNHIQPTSPSLHPSRRRSTINNTFVPTTLPHDDDEINNKARISLITANAVIVNPQSSRRGRRCATIDTSN
jgi:hypothetical protein